jgi:hypothetical protein
MGAPIDVRTRALIPVAATVVAAAMHRKTIRVRRCKY